MKITVTFTGNEKRAIMNLAEAIGENPENVFAVVDNNDTIDQVNIRNLDNGGILIIDSELTCKVIQFMERKASGIKMMTSFLKGIFEKFTDLINKNTTHRRQMINKCMDTYAHNEKTADDIESVVCVCYKGGNMETHLIFRDRLYDIEYLDDSRIIEAVMCDKCGLVTDSIDEVKSILKTHDELVKEKKENKRKIKENTDVIQDKKVTLSDKDIKNIHTRMLVRAYETRNKLGRFSDDMVAAICKYVADGDKFSVYGIWRDSTSNEEFLPSTIYDCRAIFDFETRKFIDDIDEMNEYIAVHNYTVEQNADNADC